jgi:hypothetical protein
MERGTQSRHDGEGFVDTINDDCGDHVCIDSEVRPENSDALAESRVEAQQISRDKETKQGRDDRVEPIDSSDICDDHSTDHTMRISSISGGVSHDQEASPCAQGNAVAQDGGSDFMMTGFTDDDLRKQQTNTGCSVKEEKINASGENCSSNPCCQCCMCALQCCYLCVMCLACFGEIAR